MQASPLYQSFFDEIYERGSRICAFLTETTSWWIKAINDIVHKDSSISQIDEAQLSLLWGIIGCYPYFFDVEVNSSLLLNLIDALDCLSMTGTGKTFLLPL